MAKAVAKTGTRAKAEDKAPAKKAEDSVKADRTGGFVLKSEGLSLHISGATVSILRDGQNLETQAYGFYRKAWPLFFKDAGENAEVWEKGTALNKLALQAVKRTNAAWVAAVEAITRIDNKPHQTQADKDSRAGYMAQRDRAARVASNALSRMAEYWAEESRDAEGDEAGGNARKSPRQLLEGTLAKLARYENSKLWSEADKRLARLASNALKAVLSGTFVPQLVAPATAGADQKAAGDVIISKPAQEPALM